ncbi:SGK2_2 [Blepharisma stoltei]|uniref:non-specific serine/threonine protein kinase n=1 Tax=Blepharisma stoltei TaxID=1481888 RepID=A0AAU9JGL8_9CILI|nr:unnamed protein product [Blepharisma stoltei]
MSNILINNQILGKMGCVMSCLKKKEPEDVDTPLILEDITSSNNTTQIYSSHLSPNDFKIEKVIGKGSFGKVLLVTKKDTGNYYAMKVLRKQLIEQKKQISHTLAERYILEGVKSPFIVQLRYAFQTSDKLYMVMDYMKGGELFFHLRKEGKFSEDRAKFYAAEILLAFESLHNAGVIYRDLKPENILLDVDGHIKLTDFGLSKVTDSDKKAFTFCGTPEYLAPEVLKNEGYDKAVDFWSLGVVLYEMIAGEPPFYAENRVELYKMILNTPVRMKSRFSAQVTDLLRKLIEIEVSLRLSNVKEIKKHPFFQGIDWDALSKKGMPAPFKPKIMSPLDTRNFDSEFTNEPPVDSVTKSSLIGTQNNFIGFTYQEESLK